MLPGRNAVKAACRRICPFYPNLCWSSLDAATVSGMMKLLEFAETLFRA